MTEALNKRFLAARQAVIRSRFARLNDMQQKAVMATEGPLLLLAGAGSGKTTVLIERIANLVRYGSASDSQIIPEGITEEDVLFLEQYLRAPAPEDDERADALCSLDPVQPWRIIAITFTNKAAGELKSRLENMLGTAADDIWAMTFHSACVRILHRDIDRLGFDPSFTIYDTADSQSLMKRILAELNLDDKTYPVRSVLNTISKAKDAMLLPPDYAAQASARGDLRAKNIARAYEEYARRMKNANALDFDDLILFTVLLLRDNEDVREYYRRRFRYVLIDEYQDTNRLQYLLARYLTGENGNICVVGDDDQSIYKFRGATIENILSFERQYKNARVIRLEQNYRSTGHILAAANAVIKNNTGRKGKSLWTESSDGDKLRLYVAADERAEARFVAGEILEAKRRGDKWSDCAVLYRTNAQSNQLEYAFKSSGIPYRVIGGTRFFDRAEVKDMLAYLCLLHDTADDLRLLRIINVPARGIGDKTVETARSIASERNERLYSVISNAELYPELERSAPRLRAFTDMIDGLREKAKSSPLDELYDALIEKTGYLRALEEKKTDENITRAENVGELKTNILSFMKENPGAGLAEFLDEIALYTDLDNYDRSQDCAVMMTMHSAKGLEFPTVFIVGAEENIFPSARSIGEHDDLEEERRLCYVAMTRAKRHLVFTCARQRTLYGRTSASAPSRFIEEIGEDDITKPRDLHRQEERSRSYWDDDFDGGSYGRPSYASRPAYRTGGYSARPAQPKAPSPAPAPSPALPALSRGDCVHHKTFGDGVVTMIQHVGGDALVEIAFESTGTKRLMLKSAARFLHKK